MQLRLLDVQELDSRLDTLTHQLRSIPEAATLRDLQARRTTVLDAVRDLRILVDDLTREQKRADADVEQVKARRERDQSMIDAGQVKDPKALQRMLGELESLHRRINSLEDVEIDVMERLENAQRDLVEREAELAEIDRDVSSHEQAVSRITGELEEEVGRVTAERAPIAAGIPEPLLALYERLRASKGGVGAAALRRRECGGCRLTLNASDLGVITKAPSDEVIRCEECDRILIRTSESGL